MKINFKNENAMHVAVLVVLSYFFFMCGNGVVSLTNPDEVFYAQSAKEMMQRSSWMTPYLFDAPNFEKPVFLYWLIRVGFIVFGISSFAVRFFPALFAAIGVAAVYGLGLIGFRDSRKSFYSALALMSSVMYLGLARSALTDTVFSVWILLALLAFFWGYAERSHRRLSLILFFTSCAFAVLTKGPLGLVIPLLMVLVFLSLRRDIRYIRCFDSLWGWLVFLAVASPWYLTMIQQHNTAFTHEFFYNDHWRRLMEAEHKVNDTWYFYPLTMIAGMFPWSVFVPVSLWFLLRKDLKHLPMFSVFLLCWTGVVFVVFQAAHSKLVSYILPLFPALALLTGDGISTVIDKRLSVRRVFVGMWGTLFVLPVALAAGLFLFPQYISSKPAVYFLIFLFLAALALMLKFIVQRRYVRVLAVSVFFCPVILYAIPLIKAGIEPYVSSRAAGEYLLQNIDPHSVVLSSKSFLRGVRYYTDKKVAILGPNFFSPHPVESMDTNEKLRNFLKSRPVTYGILRQADAEDIERMGGEEFDVTVLKVIGNEYVVKVETRTIHYARE